MRDEKDANRSRPRLLVIDDDRSYLGFMETLLTSEGYDVDLASSIDQATNYLGATRPDVVICDLWMPPAPRFAVLQRLAGLATAAGIPIVLCTGAVLDVDEATPLLSERRVEVLLKPFEIEALLACIERLL